MQRIFTDFKFVSGFTDITTPIEVVFKEKKGFVKISHNFAISALRSIGIPTRYVSGYIQKLYHLRVKKSYLEQMYLMLGFQYVYQILMG